MICRSVEALWVELTKRIFFGKSEKVKKLKNDLQKRLKSEKVEKQSVEALALLSVGRIDKKDIFLEKVKKVKNDLQKRELTLTRA